MLQAQTLVTEAREHAQCVAAPLPANAPVDLKLRASVLRLGGENEALVAGLQRMQVERDRMLEPTGDDWVEVERDGCTYQVEFEEDQPTSVYVRGQLLCAWAHDTLFGCQPKLTAAQHEFRKLACDEWDRLVDARNADMREAA